MITQKGKCRQKRMLTKVCVHGRFSLVTQGKRGVSSVGELLPYKQAVVGSNPSPPKKSYVRESVTTLSRFFYPPSSAPIC